MTFATFNEEHRRCLSFIKQAVADSNAKHKIVVTHHVPSVELSDYIEDSDIEDWIYHHSHYNKNLMIGRTKCVSNQLGYVFANEHDTFNSEAVLSVD